MPSRITLFGHKCILGLDEEWSEFQAWQSEYGKRYPTKEEVEERFAVYKDNKQLVARLNELYRDR